MLYINDHIQDFDLAAALAEISDQRREQALRFRHELGQRLCVAAYLLLKRGLREEYGITDNPVFVYGEHGKPAIAGHPEIHFNMSHCREAAVCVVSDHPVGVDVETFRTCKEALVRYTMSDGERRLILGSERPEVEFTRLWTMKEALLKLTGEGIRNDLKDILTVQDKQFTTVVGDRYVYTVCEDTGNHGM